VPRSVASIQAEINKLEAHLASDAGLLSNAASDGTSIGYATRERLERRLDRLYIQLARANGNAPMIVRGRVRGLRD
jgi:hypothetical protein